MMSLINWFFTWGIRLAKTTWVKMTENQFSLTASEETRYAHSLLSMRLLFADTKRDTERAHQQGIVAPAGELCTQEAETRGSEVWACAWLICWVPVSKDPNQRGQKFLLRTFVSSLFATHPGTTGHPSQLRRLDLLSTSLPLSTMVSLGNLKAHTRTWMPRSQTVSLPLEWDRGTLT